MNAVSFGHELLRASAGSGKTHQLTSRYLRLLAAGVEPEAILATTFTRKAAGEILERVLARLANAASQPDQARDLGKDPGLKGLTQETCRGLLRLVLRNFHGMRISTLDSFYIALAGGFSLELGLPAGWSICAPTDDAALRSEALERVLEQDAEAVGRLLPLLAPGESRRSVHGALLQTINVHYEIFRGSARASWELLHASEPPPLAGVRVALENLRALDLSSCGHKGFLTARDGDVARFECEDWSGFVGNGLAQRLATGETSYYNKPIPAAARTLYETLLAHAQSQIVRVLAERTRATWELLDRFHRELWALKQTMGGLRFDEVTQALAEAVSRPALTGAALAFRLDGAIEHLLLDEFQDTALSQWRVLQPLAKALWDVKARRSFFCVGDVKQAIFSWRGGMTAIFDRLPAFLGTLSESTLETSQRSTQPIIDVVNAVFGNVARCDVGEKCQDGLAAWAGRFKPHTTVKKDEAGYVCLHTGPALRPESRLVDQRAEHCGEVAEKVRALHLSAPGHDIGILCRKNDTVARMIFDLRELGVEASEEGGNPLSDSPAVELMLSLYTLADHPDHSIAWFHLTHSPLRESLGDVKRRDELSARLRRQLFRDGYGKFAHTWAKALAPACDRRDLSRLQQLIEIAYAYESRSTLRPADFVAWVRQENVADPSAANVRVMTIHAAKGLQFDIVVLPELDSTLLGQPPSFVVGRDPQTLNVNFVCRYAEEGVQEVLKKLLPPEQFRAFAEDRQQGIEESLSLLYVAMTRAVYGLYMYVPGPRPKHNRRDAWYNLLLQTLALDKQCTENALLYERGDPNWHQHVKSGRVSASLPEPAQPIRLRPADTAWPRGLERGAPSRSEGEGLISLDRYLHPSEGTGTAAGTLYHAWFATIGWLDDGAPSEGKLLDVAAKIRKDLPMELWRDLDRRLTQFRAWLTQPLLRTVLTRSAYTDVQGPGFPKALADLWSKGFAPQKVEQERRFLLREGSRLWDGSFDRVVWLADGNRLVAADVLDFKTDALPPDDDMALAARTAHYRPQLEIYRRAAAQLASLPLDAIALRLVFPFAGRVVEL